MPRIPNIDIGDPDPASLAELRHVYDCWSHLQMAQKWMPLFMHGWALAAPFGGLLTWRTHVMLTGPSGSGKSTITRELLARCLGEWCIRLEGSTTEAGLRRTIGVSSLPVVMDENETKGRTQNARATVKEILHLARLSSSESGCHIQHGDGMTYRPRSMFWFNQVFPEMNDEADLNRFVKCEIQRQGDNWRRKFTEWEGIVHEIKGGYWQRAIWWAYDNMADWVKSTQVFKRVFDAKRASARRQDVLSPIYGIAALSVLGQVPTEEEAVKMLDDMLGGDDMEAQRDEEILLNLLLGRINRFHMNDSYVEMTTREMITRDREWGSHHNNDYHKNLLRLGFRVVHKKEIVLFSTTGEGIHRALRDHPQWQDGWQDVLLRLPGSARMGPSRISGAKGKSSERSIAVDINLCVEDKYGDDDE